MKKHSEAKSLQAKKADERYLNSIFSLEIIGQESLVSARECFRDIEVHIIKENLKLLKECLNKMLLFVFRGSNILPEVAIFLFLNFLIKT